MKVVVFAQQYNSHASQGCARELVTHKDEEERH